MTSRALIINIHCTLSANQKIVKCIIIVYYFTGNNFGTLITGSLIRGAHLTGGQVDMSCLRKLFLDEQKSLF